MNEDTKNYKSSDKESLLRKIKKILQEKSNLTVLIILSIAVLYAIMVRFINLGELSFWGDDGMTYLSSISILKYGYPLLPSGNIMFHNIASAYFNIIPVLLFGDNEFAYRFLNALLGVLLIPLVFLFIRELTNKYIALIASIVIAVNA